MNYDFTCSGYNDHGLGWAQAQYDRQEPPEPDPILHCGKCGNGIYEGEFYFRIDGDDICETCLNDEFGRFAEWEEK